MKITAVGKMLGIDVTVTCTLKDNIPMIQVEGELPSEVIELLQDRFNSKLKDPPAMGGTFYPPENSMLAASGILQTRFFDRGTLKELTVDGDIGKIPMDDPNTIY